MDDAAGARFALIGAELDGVFGAMDEDERAEAVGVCRQGPLRRSLRVGDLDCFLCLTFEGWVPLGLPGWTGLDTAELLAYAADHLSVHRDEAPADAYPASSRRRISTCRLMESWIHGDSDTGADPAGDG